jgi:hypothetical protein
MFSPKGGDDNESVVAHNYISLEFALHMLVFVEKGEGLLYNNTMVSISIIIASN